MCFEVFRLIVIAPDLRDTLRISLQLTEPPSLRPPSMSTHLIPEGEMTMWSLAFNNVLTKFAIKEMML